MSCRNLDDLDFFTVTDSFLVVKLIEMDKPERNILRTKVYFNDLNPNYAETVLIDFYFESKTIFIQSNSAWCSRCIIKHRHPNWSDEWNRAWERSLDPRSMDWCVT